MTEKLELSFIFVDTFDMLGELADDFCEEFAQVETSLNFEKVV